MAKILLVNPPYRLGWDNFPMGLGYIGAVLLKAGHDVHVIDVEIFNYSEQELTELLSTYEYDILGLGGMITIYNFAKFVCQRVKALKPHVKIICGGGLISSTPSTFLSHSQADIGVIGEGEATVVDLVNALETGRDLSTVDGIIYKHDGRLIQTGPRAVIQNLDAIPFPAWDLFHTKDIYAHFPQNNSIFQSKPMLNFVTTRGCPYRCTFCYTDKEVRQRSIDNVMAELEELKGRYHIAGVHINDDLFVVRKERTVRFCEEMIRRKINLFWHATGRCNLIAEDINFLRLLKRAGCVFLALGIESGSSTVLKRMYKQQTPEQIVKAVRNCAEVGIRPGGTFILGMPGETAQTIRETVEVYKQLNAYRRHANKFFFATPYPGTPLYDEMKTKGKIGDENRYFERLSSIGDAVAFVINCTDSLSDEELMQTKVKIEEEVLRDFARKHPVRVFSDHVGHATGWTELKNFIVHIKMYGWASGWAKLTNKLKELLKFRRPHYERHWTKPADYLLTEERQYTF